MGTPNYPKDLASEWTQMKRDVKNAWTSANLRVGMAKIGARVVEITGELIMNAGATLIAKYSNNINALYIGPFSYNGNSVDGINIRRFDGSSAWRVFGGPNEPGFMAFYDRSGNIIISDDAASGQGLARPWLPYNVISTQTLTNPTVRATTTTFEPHHTVSGVMQHPRIMARVLIQATSGEVSQWRIRNPATGQVVATSANITGPVWTDLTGNHDDYAFGHTFTYDIEVRRVSGSGSGIGITPGFVLGVQSP